jgi:hypothetical protein
MTGEGRINTDASQAQHDNGGLRLCMTIGGFCLTHDKRGEYARGDYDEKAPKTFEGFRGCNHLSKSKLF